MDKEKTQDEAIKAFEELVDAAIKEEKADMKQLGVDVTDEQIRDGIMETADAMLND